MKMKWDVIASFTVVHLFYLSVIIFQHDTWEQWWFCSPLEWV